MTKFEWVTYQYVTVTLKVWVLVRMFIMGHKGLNWQGCSDSEIYLNPDLTNGFRSVLIKYFIHNAISPLKSDMHN